MNEEVDYVNEDELSAFCSIRMRKISERTLNIMLMEMRKLDRDRERIIHPSTLDNLVQKYKLPITPCLTRLKQKFEDENYPGYTNYEDVIRFADLFTFENIIDLTAGILGREDMRTRSQKYRC